MSASTILLILSTADLAHAQERATPGPHLPPAEHASWEPRGLLSEPVAFERVVAFFERGQGNGALGNGMFLETNTNIPGSGVIAVGPGYRKWYDGDRMVAEASGAVSVRAFKAAGVRVELPKLARSRLALGTAFRWQDFPRIDYFGQESDAAASGRTQYQLRSADVAALATLRPARDVAITGQFAWMSPSVSAGEALPVVVDPGRRSFFRTEAGIVADTRDFPGHPTYGGLVRAAAANYLDRNGGGFSFRRYEAEAARFLPFAGAHVVVALHGWLVGSSTSAGQRVPLYLQPNLGGDNTIRSYRNFRFHDRHMAVVNVETRLALTAHVDAAIFADSGSVASRVRDLDLSRRGIGGGIRFHSRRQTFARMDVARGPEGWRMTFQMNDPLALNRLARRTPAAPFVP